MTRPRWGAYALVCLSHTFMHVFTEMHIALIPILRTELSLDTLTIGLMVSTPLLIQTVLTIPAGLLADRINRLQMMAASLIVTAIGGFLVAQAHNVLQLIAFTSLLSISSTLLHPPALSTVDSLVSPKIKGKALGIFNSSGTFGIALGPITLSFLMNTVGWRTVYLMWSIPALLIPVVILRLKLEKTEGSKDRQYNEKTVSAFHVLRNLSLILLLAVMGARAMSGTTINTYITPYFVDRLMIEPAMASLIFGLRPLIGILASPIGGIMVDRVGEKKWIVLDLIVQIASLSTIALFPSSTWIIFGYLLYSFFGNMEMPAMQSLVAKLTPKSGRGLAFSLSFLPATLTGAVSPILAAIIVEAWGIWYIFPFALIMLCVAISVLGFLRSSPK